jgi:response regulator RpfG family c-di-GMP phosphodiesterase
MLVTLAEMAREFSAADRATIWMSDEANSTLWTKVAHGMGPITIPNSAGIVGFVYKNGEIVVSNDPYSDSRFNQEVDRKTGYRTKSILAIPIKNSENEIIGALQTINKLASKDDFNDADVAKLKLVSSYIGNTVELANLHKEIEDTQKEVIFTMGEAGEFRSKETGNHVKRVAEYSYILAQGCGLDDTTSDLLRMASPMHDIGKVAIEDAILKKPGKLTDEEFEIMKTHTTMGYEILRHSKRRIISAAATVAYEHHEKFNGRGYPRGLAGEDIHIFGRITALADVFDALGSDRCYKKAWELEKIFELFNREKGEHFDPKIVDTFFKNLDRILEVRDRFRDV